MKRVLRHPGGETVDEIVADGVTFHLEQMDSNCYWIGLTDSAGNGIAVNLVGAGDIVCTVEPDGPGWWDEDREHESD